MFNIFPTIIGSLISFLDAVKKVEATYPPYEKFKSTGRFVQRYYTLDNLKYTVAFLVISD
ncbi:hypothetical protein FC756_18895 [Lysinibacillus mangiferihumi]|uniref:Uncharacterized protein n=1 Tax=Lysinibacillus mangiferihumi TaxID=1130819 RepID=A0A4U2YQE0_9BACI|nr:hypothetical protein FC756_18895 [Lysinibacillus mangiferihumi]